MQVSIETTTGLERKLTVGIPADRIEGEVGARLAKAAKTVRIDGFRKGKVPVKVVKQRFGGGIRQEVVGELISSSFQEAIVKESIQPAGQPSIESVKNEDGQDLEYVATFEVYPEIELADFAAIEVKKPVAEIGDADLDKMIDVLQQQQASWSEVDRPAQQGDTVKIDYVGTKDGEEFDGGKAEDQPLELGSNKMIPGFEDAIIGMSAGEQKVASLTFPEDYQSEELKGASVEFTITVRSVSEKTLPEMDDEFFAKYGVTEGGEEKFREEVRNNMERELKNALESKLKNRVMDQLLKLHTVALPSALITSEIQNLKQQMVQQYGGGQQFDLSILPDDMFRDQAERRVSLGLLISEIVKSAEIKVDADKVKNKIDEIAATYEQPEEVVQYYRSNQQMMAGLEAAVLEEQVVEHLLASAKLEVEQQSYEEALKPDQQEASDAESE
ncbi:MAG: trigger factor [Porticoccaceae bacterium]|nr:trigger factor [Pseudomonadales bacterium]MCP5171513.1 trigger factor [Pseudomonadales bacterium]